MKLTNRIVGNAFLMALLLLLAGCGKGRNEQKEPAPPTSVASSPESNSNAELTGIVYVGMGGSAITLYDDETADYYWNDHGVDEGNPWSSKNDVITVRLSSLNCDIYADIDKDDPSLTFQSDSINWDDELFIKVGTVQKKLSEDEYDKLVQTVKQKIEEKSESSVKSDPKAPKIEKKISNEVQSGTSEDMRPEFKEAMDSYRSFYDEYCKVLKQYHKDPTDTALLTKYLDLMARLNEVDENFKAWNEDEMNQAELNYYLKIQKRVTKKLLKVMQ